MSNKKAHTIRMLAHLERVMEDRAESAVEPPFSGIYGATQMNLLLDVLLTDNWEMAARKVALKSVRKRFDNDPLTPSFASALDWLIEKYQPDLWIHGHTHDSCDYNI